MEYKEYEVISLPFIKCCLGVGEYYKKTPVRVGPDGEVESGPLQTDTCI